MSAILALLAAGTLAAVDPALAPAPAVPYQVAARRAKRPSPAPKPTPVPTPAPVATPGTPLRVDDAAPAARTTPAAESLLPAAAAGVVVDAVTGEPLAGVLVQQEGAVTSAFTQADGTFRLLLDRTGGARLTVSAVGYDAVELPIGSGRDLRVRLAALAGFVPASPMLPSAPTGLSAAETAPLNTGLMFAYRLRQQTMSAGAARIEGLASNDYRLGLRFRLRPLLLEAEGAHWQSPVDVAALDRSANPAFKPSTWQAGARVGLLTPVFHPDLELAALAGYRWTNTVPNNNDVPYTGSDLDWEQNRHALGPVALLAWRPWRGRLHFEGSYGYYPYLSASADAPGMPFATSLLTDVRGLVGFEVVPGMRLGLGYQAEHWSGNGDDLSRMVTVQVHYTPGGAPKGLE